MHKPPIHPETYWKMQLVISNLWSMHRTLHMYVSFWSTRDMWEIIMAHYDYLSQDLPLNFLASLQVCCLPYPMLYSG